MELEPSSLGSRPGSTVRPCVLTQATAHPDRGLPRPCPGAHSATCRFITGCTRRCTKVLGTVSAVSVLFHGLFRDLFFAGGRTGGQENRGQEPQCRPRSPPAFPPHNHRPSHGRHPGRHRSSISLLTVVSGSHVPALSTLCGRPLPLGRNSKHSSHIFEFVSRCLSGSDNFCPGKWTEELLGRWLETAGPGSWTGRGNEAAKIGDGRGLLGPGRDWLAGDEASGKQEDWVLFCARPASSSGEHRCLEQRRTSIQLLF